MNIIYCRSFHACTHSAIFLVTVVERAKKCLDFAATIHLFHFLGCLVYAGFPTAWLWWLLMLFSLLCMTSTSSLLIPTTRA